MLDVALAVDVDHVDIRGFEGFGVFVEFGDVGLSLGDELLAFLVYHILELGSSQVLLLCGFLVFFTGLEGFLFCLFSLLLFLNFEISYDLLVLFLDLFSVEYTRQPPFFINLQNNHNLRQPSGLSHQLHQIRGDLILLHIIEIPINQNLLHSLKNTPQNLDLMSFLIEVSSLLIQFCILNLLALLIEFGNFESFVIVSFSFSLDLFVL